MSDLLIFDMLLSAGGVKHPHTLYPPRDLDSLRRLLDAIEETTYDALKKDCLIYFLLKWHRDGREERFQEDRCIPPQFVALADAYWHLDSGIDVPVSIISSPYCILLCTECASARRQSALRRSAESRLPVKNSASPFSGGERQ